MARIDFKSFGPIYRELKDDDQRIRDHAVFAMGVLCGGGFAGAHAALVILFQRAFPEAPLPDAVIELLDMQP